MAKPDANSPDIRLALAAGSFTGNGSSPWVIMDGPFNVTFGNPSGGTITLEKTFDNGATVYVASRDTAGTPASYTTPVSMSWPEFETGTQYRLTMAGYVTGTIPYRLSR